MIQTTNFEEEASSKQQTSLIINLLIKLHPLAAAMNTLRTLKPRENVMMMMGHSSGIPTYSLSVRRSTTADGQIQLLLLL